MIDTDAERKVIAGILLADDPHSDLRLIDLPVKAFTVVFHRHVWESMLLMHDERSEINLATLRFALNDWWKDIYPSDDSGIEALGTRLMALMEGHPKHAYVRAAVERVRNLGYRRELAKLAADSEAWAKDPAVSIGQAQMSHTTRTRELRETWGRDGARGTSAGIVTRLGEFYVSHSDKAVRTGYERLDDALGEVHPGTVMTILARPAIGKSNLGLNLVANWLLEEGADWGMMFCSMEMPETLAASRLIRMTEDWTLAELHTCFELNKKPTEFMSRAEGRLVVSDRGGLSMETLDEEFKRAEISLGRPVRAVVLDYLQLMRGAQRLKKYEQIAALTSDLKEFAKRKDVFLVLLSQVGRGDSGGGGSRCPNVQSARDSGTIEESADFMLGMWRPDLAKDCKETLRDLLMLRVLKGRNGGLNEQVAMQFDTDTLRMTETWMPVS